MLLFILTLFSSVTEIIPNETDPEYFSFPEINITS